MEGSREKAVILTALACETISKGKHHLYTEAGTNGGNKTGENITMDGSKAAGIDGVTKEIYEENLETNIKDLVERLKRKSYRPKPARRVEIPKDNGKTRPLNIYCYEDKLVQEALKRILEAVFEPHFYDEMMGFRPNRGCHQACQTAHCGR